MRPDAFDHVDELHPLLFRRRAPALEPAFVEGADDLVQRILLRLAVPVAAGIGILRVKLRIRGIQLDALVELGALQLVNLVVDISKALLVCRTEVSRMT